MNASYKEYTERYTLFLSKAYFISFREILSSYMYNTTIQAMQKFYRV